MVGWSILGFTGDWGGGILGIVGEFSIGLWAWGLKFEEPFGRLIVRGPLWLLVLMFRFFLKSLGGTSSTLPIESIFPIVLVLWATVASSKIFASWILLILLVIFSFSTSPTEFILIWKSYIQLILRMGSLVSIREIRVLMKVETCPGNWRSLLLRTSIRLAIELDWKGHIPKIIS